MIFIFGTYLKLRNICILFLFNRGNLISNWVKNISSQLQHTPHIINIYFITFSCYMFSWTKYIWSIHYHYFKFKFHYSYSLINTEYFFFAIGIIKKRSINILYHLALNQITKNKRHIRNTIGKHEVFNDFKRKLLSLGYWNLLSCDCNYWLVMNWVICNIFARLVYGR